jgi:hypothetical protein
VIVPTTKRWAALGARLRGVVLVLVALFVAHDAIYLARYGEGYARAMAVGGHEAYWMPLGLVIAGAAAGTFLLWVRVIVRLQDGAAGTPFVAGPTYFGEVVSIWRRLLPSVALLFTLQENAEALLAHGRVVLLDPVIGPDAAWIVPPVLLVLTFVLAALGAIIRWRIRVLEARIARARQARAFPPPRARVVPRRWGTIAASIAQHWILARRDAGRAPPAVLRPFHAAA